MNHKINGMLVNLRECSFAELLRMANKGKRRRDRINEEIDSIWGEIIRRGGLPLHLQKGDDNA